MQYRQYQNETAGKIIDIFQKEDRDSWIKLEADKLGRTNKLRIEILNVLLRNSEEEYEEVAWLHKEADKDLRNCCMHYGKLQEESLSKMQLSQAEFKNKKKHIAKKE